MDLAQAAALADQYAAKGLEKELATLRSEWGDEVEHAARNPDYRVRALAYRSIAQFRFRQKLELLRRGLEDESPAVRGSALISLEGLSRTAPGDVRASPARILSPAERRASSSAASNCARFAGPSPFTPRRSAAKMPPTPR